MDFSENTKVFNYGLTKHSIMVNGLKTIFQRHLVLLDAAFRPLRAQRGCLAAPWPFCCFARCSVQGQFPFVRANEIGTELVRDKHFHGMPHYIAISPLMNKIWPCVKSLNSWILVQKTLAPNALQSTLNGFERSSPMVMACSFSSLDSAERCGGIGSLAHGRDDERGSYQCPRKKTFLQRRPLGR